MITIFASPKNFEGVFNHIQKNALNSWRSLGNNIQIIILGDSQGSKENAKMINALYIPDVKSSKSGVPYLSDMFLKAKKYSKYDILTFINADIILPKNFLDIVSKVYSQYSNKFLLVGHRWDLEVNKHLDYRNNNEIAGFWEHAKINSKKHPESGIDYFVFKKSMFKKVPDFVIGRPGYDNWLIWKARRQFVPLIDISNDIFALHQNHHFNFHNLSKDPKIFLESDGLKNKKLHGKRLLNLSDANYFTQQGIVYKHTSKDFFNRNLGRLPIIFYEFSFILILFKKIYRLRNRILKN